MGVGLNYLAVMTAGANRALGVDLQPASIAAAAWVLLARRVRAAVTVLPVVDNPIAALTRCDLTGQQAARSATSMGCSSEHN